MRKIQVAVFWCERTLGSLLFGVLFVMVSLGIFARYFFGRPIFWVEELSNFSFIWIGFLSCSYTFGHSRHMSINIFIRILPEKARIFLDFAQGILLELTFLDLIVPSFRAMREFALSSALRIPEKFIFMIVPITVCLFAYHNIVILYRIFQQATPSEIASKKGGR